MRFIGKTGIFALTAVSLLLSAAPASAGHVYEVPTAWRLQNYMGNVVVAYFISVQDCPNGGIAMPSSSTNEDKNRFWSAVMTARATNKAVGIFYSISGGSCYVDSFYLQS